MSKLNEFTSQTLPNIRLRTDEQDLLDNIEQSHIHV